MAGPPESEREVTDAFKAPADAALERILIGLLIREPELLDRPQVHGDLFHVGDAQRAFGVLHARRLLGDPIDLVSTADALAAAGVASAYTVLTGWWDAAEPHIAASVIPHLATLARKRLLWRSARTLDAMVADATNEGHAETLGTVLDQLQDGADRHTQQDSKPASQVVSEYLDQVMLHGGLSGLSTGYPLLDYILGGYRPSEFSVLAARSSVGKSAWALDSATRVAQDGHGVEVFSIEMSEFQVGERLTAGATGLSTLVVRKGRFEGDDLRRIEEAPLVMPPCLRIWDVCDVTTAELVGRIRRSMARRRIGLVVVDHLGFMAEPRERGENDAKRYGRMCRTLKLASRTLGVHILALHQLNRRSEDGPTMSEPALSDLRDSGEIEEFADNVLLLHRVTRDAEDATLIVAKNRQGPVGDIPLRFVKHTTQFVPTRRLAAVS